MYFVSARLARPIETVSQELKAVESLSFGSPPVRKSRIGEIAQLQLAAALLRNSLQSFSSFVPLGVVSGVAGFSEDAASLYLKPGDVIEAEIEKIGVLRNPVISWREAHGEPAPPRVSW